MPVRPSEGTPVSDTDWDATDEQVSTPPPPTPEHHDESEGGDPPSQPTQEQDEPEEDLPSFDQRWSDEFLGLLYLGKLTDTFHWVGHEFTIRTLTVDETLEVGLLHKPYLGSMGEARAYQAAIVAACVVTVDGRPLSVPLTDEPSDTELVNRFNYVRRHWFFPAIDAIYTRYLGLESKVGEVIASLEDVTGKEHSAISVPG